MQPLLLTCAGDMSFEQTLQIWDLGFSVLGLGVKISGVEVA